MPVQQLNIFICEVCGYIETTLQTTGIYWDNVVIPPNRTNWGHNKNDKLACPECMKKDNE